MQSFVRLAAVAAVLALSSSAAALLPRAKIYKNPRNGAVLSVKKGASVIVQFSGNPTAGYRWNVTGVSRSLGYPEISYKAASAAVGSGGVTSLTWKTSGMFPSIGRHAVTFEYKRGWERRAVKTIKATIEVVK